MKLTELYGEKLIGSVKGLDRVRFRGTIRWLASEHGIRTFVSSTGRLLKDFGNWASGLTKQVRASCAEHAQHLSIPILYLQSSTVDKEQLARQISERDGRSNGSICMFSVVEPCVAPVVKGNREEKTVELYMRHRKCVWIYHYFDDPKVGFGHIRIQTWLPFTINVCLNGRHWLEKQLLSESIGYLKDGNCFPYLQDIDAAQKLMDNQLRTDWPQLLNGILLNTCPILPHVLAPFKPHHYWSADQTEYATDFMFRSPGQLAEIYPALIRHAMVISDSPTVLRFFGKRNITASGKITGHMPTELSSDCCRRAEGLRIKHRLNENSVKMYDKSGSILRIETTINQPRSFKTFRSPSNNPQRPPSWQRMRKGVSDLHRRCQVSDACNQRYEEAVSTARLSNTLQQVAGDCCNRVCKRGRHYRPLNPWHPRDFKLLTFLAKGEWALNGFRNCDLRLFLFPDSATADTDTARKLSGRTTRLIRLLRGHSLIRKVPRENRYVLTTRGRNFSAAFLTASAVDVKGLMELVA